MVKKTTYGSWDADPFGNDELIMADAPPAQMINTHRRIISDMADSLVEWTVFHPGGVEEGTYFIGGITMVVLIRLDLTMRPVLQANLIEVRILLLATTQPDFTQVSSKFRHENEFRPITAVVFVACRLLHILAIASRMGNWGNGADSVA